MKRLLTIVLLLSSFVNATYSQIAGYSYQTHLAVNMPFRGPEIGMSRAMPKLADLGVRLYRHLTYGDVLWQQVEAQDDQWNFIYSDSAIFNELQIASLATFYSYCTGPDTVGLQVPWRACQASYCGWHLSDSSDSRDYVATVINRYREAVKYWEIGNELDTHNQRPKSLPPLDLVDFLCLNYSWIKSIQPQAQVVLPSLTGTYGLPLGDFDWLRAILTNGGYDCFDILGYHDYNSWWTLAAHVDSIKRAFRECGYEPKPMWVTECSISSDPASDITPPYSSIDGQAADVWRRSAILFAEGVQKLFWHPFWSGSALPWREFGLLNSKGIKKKSFHAFKLLLTEIDSFQTAQKISYGRVTNDNESGGEGVWVIRFTFSGDRHKWVLWSPDSQSYTLTLNGFSLAEVTHVVPYFISPDGERALFQKDTLSLVNGTLSLNLSQYPLLVKGINAVTIEQSAPHLHNYALYDCYPNPATQKAFIDYYLPVGSRILLSVYNTLGQKVRTLAQGYQAPGKHSVILNTRGLAAGVYFYVLRVNNRLTLTKKIALIP